MNAAVKIALDIALQAGLIFLFLGSLFTLAVGVSLLLGMPWVQQLNERSKRWISTREAFRPMDVPRDIEKALYRRHLPVGLLIAAGAAYILYIALFGYDARAIARLVAPRPSVVVEMLVQTLWWFGVVGGIAGFAVGLVMAAKPQWLHQADAWMNRSYSARQATKPLETLNFAPDGWLAAAPKLCGGIIVLCSVYVAIVLGALLLAGK